MHTFIIFAIFLSLGQAHYATKETSKPLVSLLDAKQVYIDRCDRVSRRRVDCRAHIDGKAQICRYRSVIRKGEKYYSVSVRDLVCENNR